MDEDVSGFASLFRRFLQQMTEMGSDQAPSELRSLIEGHLGQESAGFAVVSGSFLPLDQANVQIALAHYLSEEGTTHESVGLSGQSRHYGSFADLLEMGEHAGIQIGRPDLVDIPIGPDETIAAVQFGIFVIARGDDRLVVLMRGPDEHGPVQSVILEVISADPARAREFLAEVRRLVVELNIFRGQVISFGTLRSGTWPSDRSCSTIVPRSAGTSSCWPMGSSTRSRRRCLGSVSTRIDCVKGGST